MNTKKLSEQDHEVAGLIDKEANRQRTNLSLIPSENIFSPAVREAVGSIFMQKYSEGNVGARYYEGNEYVDALESLAMERAKKLFNLPADWSVNVQALAGSNANIAVYLGVLPPGSTILSMYLPDGGHLSHGWSYSPAKDKGETSSEVYLGGTKKVNISSRLYNIVQYKTDPKTHLFDYDQIQELANKYKPNLIITGGTAYPRDIDYKKMKAIADSVGALYMADIAHEAGLIAASVLNSPVGIADIVTMTTHKTLRSGRGAIILGRSDLIKKINKGVLPGLQGGPFNNNIAGICVGLGEALQDDFKLYAKAVIDNAKALAEALSSYGFDLLTGGTDKHLILIDMTNKGIFGKYTARALNFAGLVCNMNTMPGEKRSPADPSAIRLGTPSITTRGLGKAEMLLIAKWINNVVEEVKQWAGMDFEAFQEQVKSSPVIISTKKEVEELCLKFPVGF